MNKEVLMQPNNLIKSKYNFTSTENKVFYKMLFNAQKQHKYSNAYTVKITKDELRAFIKNNNDFQHSNIKEILTRFQLSVLEFQYIDDNGKLKTFSSGLIQNYTLDHDDHEYTIEIHETLYKYITDTVKMQKIGNGYTAIDLSLLFSFKSIYSQRLYTLLRLWSRENQPTTATFKLQDLRAYLDLPEDMYSEYKHFKQRILKKALSEIKEKGKMDAEIIKETRKKRKVDEIVFSITDYEPRKYFGNKQVVEIIDEDNITIIDTTELPDATEKAPEVKVEVKHNDDKTKEIKPTESVKAKTEVVDMYIPDETIFTKGTLRSIKLDFSDVDFFNKNMQQAFNDTVMEIFDEYDVDKIKASTYPSFRKVLREKIEELS